MCVYVYVCVCACRASGAPNQAPMDERCEFRLVWLVANTRTADNKTHSGCLARVLTALLSVVGAADRMVGWADLPELSEHEEGIVGSSVDITYSSAFAALFEAANRDVRAVP